MGSDRDGRGTAGAGKNAGLTLADLRRIQASLRRGSHSGSNYAIRSVGYCIDAPDVIPAGGMECYESYRFQLVTKREPT